MSVQSEITRLENAKTSIKMAIESKGVSVPSTVKLDDMYSYIEYITSIDDIPEYDGSVT